MTDDGAATPGRPRLRQIVHMVADDGTVIDTWEGDFGSFVSPAACDHFFAEASPSIEVAIGEFHVKCRKCAMEAVATVGLRKGKFHPELNVIKRTIAPYSHASPSV